MNVCYVLDVYKLKCTSACKLTIGSGGDGSLYIGCNMPIAKASKAPIEAVSRGQAVFIKR